MKKHFLILGIVAFIMLSCEKKKECPAFDDADLQYVPYNTGDILKFVNTQSDLFEITIGEFRKSESYNSNCNDVDGVCPCIDSISVYATDTENSTSYVFLELEQSDASEMQYYKYLVNDFYFEFDFRNELPHVGDFDHITLIGNMEISGVTYNSVIEYTNTFNSSSDISKVYLNQANGILMFVEKSSGEVWSLVD